MRKIRFLLVALGLLVCSPPLWGGEGRNSRIYLEQWDTILEASRKYDLSPLLVWAVISVESEFSSPYVMGMDRSAKVLAALKRASQKARFVVRKVSRSRLAVFPASRIDGERVIRVLEAAGVSFDVGLGQINNRTARSFGVDPVSLLDMKHNVTFTAFYLRRIIDKHGADRVWKYNGSRAYRRKLLARLEAASRGSAGSFE